MKQAQASGKRSYAKRTLFSRMLAQWDLQILVVPGILLVLLFSYVPMYGVVMGFQDFQLGDFPGFSQWVGFKHFQTMFADKYFGLAMRNTLVISALKMFIGFPLPIFFAVLLNEMNFQPLKKTVQTVSYLPHFISWVVCATLMFDLMSTDGGAINEFLMWIGVIKEPIGFFTEGKYFWGITLCTDIWKELGWNAIIFISAITSISQDMYEAADIDGATRAQKMWHITIKSIKPTIIPDVYLPGRRHPECKLRPDHDAHQADGQLHVERIRRRARYLHLSFGCQPGSFLLRSSGRSL